MSTNPPRSLSPFDSRGRRVLRLPNGTGTYICVGSKPWAGDGDPLEYIGWVWREYDPTQADLTDLTDDEIREICRASAAECEGVIARIAASRKAADPPAEAAAPSLRAQGLGAREPTWEEPEDLVSEPPHYRLPGDREALEDVIAPICDALSERGLPGSTTYMVGNALKYLSRLGAKGSPLEDLRKAREYLDRAISRMDAGV